MLLHNSNSVEIFKNYIFGIQLFKVFLLCLYITGNMILPNVSWQNLNQPCFSCFSMNTYSVISIFSIIHIFKSMYHVCSRFKVHLLLILFCLWCVEIALSFNMRASFCFLMAKVEYKVILRQLLSMSVP